MATPREDPRALRTFSFPLCRTLEGNTYLRETNTSTTLEQTDMWVDLITTSLLSKTKIVPWFQSSSQERGVTKEWCKLATSLPWVVPITRTILTTWLACPRVATKAFWVDKASLYTTITACWTLTRRAKTFCWTLADRPSPEVSLPSAPTSPTACRVTALWRRTVQAPPT